MSLISDGWPQIYTGYDTLNKANCTGGTCQPVSGTTYGSETVRPAEGGSDARHFPATQQFAGNSNYLMYDGHVKFISLPLVGVGNNPTGAQNLGSAVVTFNYRDTAF